MANTNLSPELAEALLAISESFNRTREHVDEFGNAISESEAKKRSEEARAKAARDKYQAELLEFSNKISRAGNNIVSSVGQMTSPDGAFSTLGNVAGDVVKGLTGLVGKLGPFGAAIAGLGEVAGSAIKMLTSETQKAFNTFNKISGSGVVASFQDMRQTAKTANLTFEEFGAALTQNSEALAAFGQGAIDGGKKMAAILAQNAGQAALNMQKMGVTAQEFAEIQTAYIAQQTSLGFARGKSDKQLAQESAKYAEELTVLSRLTGKSRADLQKEQQRQMNDARFRAHLASLSAEEAKKLQMGMSMFRGNVQKGLMDVIASGSALSSKESQELALQLGNAGVDLQALSQQFNSGKITMEQMFQIVSKGAADYVASNKEQVALIGPQGPLFSNFVDLADQAKFVGLSMEEAKKVTEKQVEEQKKQSDATAELAKRSQSLAVRFQQITTSTKLMAEGLNIMAASIDKLLDVLETVTDEKLRKKPVDYAKTGGIIGGVGGAIVGGTAGFFMGGPAGAAIGALKGAAYGTGLGVAAGTAYGTSRAMDDTGARRGLRQESGAGTPQPGQAGRRLRHEGGAGTPTSAVDDLVRIQSKTGKSAMVGEQYAPAFQSLVDYLDSVGYKIYSLGGYNDRDVTGRPGVKSIHAHGAAIDINPQSNPYGNTLITDLPSDIGSVASELGLGWGGNWNNVKDAMHFSAATSEGGSLLRAAKGAIIPPTPGGSLVNVAEAGQSEAIIPMPDGKTIPVSMKNFNTTELANKMDAQNMLLSQVVMLLSKGNKIQSNIAANIA